MSRHRIVACALCIWPLLLPACKPGGGGGEGGDGGETKDPETATLPTLDSDDPVGKQVIAQMDLGTDPCVDFYQYACGGWIADNPLPEDKPRWGRGFGELGDANNELLRDILEHDEGRAGAFYAACMDESAIDGRGVEPLDPYLEAITKLDPRKTKKLFTTLGQLDASVGLGAFFNFGLSIDFEQPNLHIADLGQGGTGLPDRSFYLDDAKKAQVLPFYQLHIARMLGFLGYDEAQAADAATRIIALETKLAELQKPPEEMRDPEEIYHRWDRKGVERQVKLPWRSYFKAIGAPKIELINVSNPEFIEGLPAIIAEADPETVKDYLRFFLISNTADDLSAEVVEANFQFVAAITGQQKLQPRWERCVATTNGAVGDLVSQSFVERSFAGDSKDVALDMIRRIEAAFAAGLPSLAWMDEPTRDAARVKVERLENKIGYPERWRTYDGLEFSGAYFSDVIAARSWMNDYALAKVGGEVDKKEWFWPASIVNASYNPLANQMSFPAGILQPPFFHRDHPKAMNFGAMGMVMGHELTHGFDDSGRKFDGAGVMREWWAPEVAARYEQQTQCIVETYSALEVQPGTHLKGELTLGENIADFGGVKEAYSAYQAWVEEHGEEPQLIDGLANDQLFFVAMAQSWCTVSSPEIDKLLATVDPHSPPKYRVNVPSAHFSGFWDAFSCAEGTPMHPEEVCTVW